MPGAVLGAVGVSGAGDRGTGGQAFSPLVAGGMVVVGVVCFAAFVVVLALARGPGARDGGAHVLSRSAVGFAGVAELMEATGDAGDRQP